MNLINGKPMERDEALRYLDQLETYVARTLCENTLDAQTVILAADRLSNSLDTKVTASLFRKLNISQKAAESMLLQAKRLLSKEYLESKMRTELGCKPFDYQNITDLCRVVYRPLGVITHIAAGNAAGLPAFSVLEALLTGNISLLKLPGYDDGLSTSILQALIDIEPQLAPYIYVFDFASTDVQCIEKLLAVSDACAVWGSDFAVSGIRAIAPPGLQLIEWGHKLSFACITKKGETLDSMMGIAKDICENEQLLCNSPQCVYYEAEDFDDLVAFGHRLADYLSEACKAYPPKQPDINTQAEITQQLLLLNTESLIKNVQVIHGDGFAVIADDNPQLCASPKYRTVWLKPLNASHFFDVLRRQKNYLQTAGLACASDEFEAFERLLYKSGICRIMKCGSMASTPTGEPHDGQYALRRYVKAIVSMPPS